MGLVLAAIAVQLTLEGITVEITTMIITELNLVLKKLEPDYNIVLPNNHF